MKNLLKSFALIGLMTVAFSGCRDEDLIKPHCIRGLNNAYTEADIPALLAFSNDELYAIASAGGIGKCLVIKTYLGKGSDDISSISYHLQLQLPGECRPIYQVDVKPSRNVEGRDEISLLLRGYIQTGSCFPAI